MTAFDCAGCDRLFCWGCEVALEGRDHEVKTVGSRYCPGCIDQEAAAHGLPVETVRAIRARRWGGEPCEHRGGRVSVVIAAAQAGAITNELARELLATPELVPDEPPARTWKLKVRTNPGSPIHGDYECATHGYFAATLPRDASGDPPVEAPCPIDGCGAASPWRVSMPLGRVKLAELDQGKVFEYPSNPANVLDTRPLADGMPLHEWRAKQEAVTRDVNIARRRQRTGRGGKVFVG